MFKSLLLLFFLTCSFKVSADSTHISIGEEAPLFALPNLKNEYIALRDICGEKLRKPWKNKQKHAVVISFFASWCQPCIAEIPHLEKIKEKFSEQSVKFYLINVGESKEKVSKFLKNKNISIDVLLDKYKKIAEKYDALTLPRLFVIDQNGFIQLEKRGFTSGDELELELEILLNRLLKT